VVSPRAHLQGDVTYTFGTNVAGNTGIEFIKGFWSVHAFTQKKKDRSSKPLQILYNALVSHLVSSCCVVGDLLALLSRCGPTTAFPSSLSQCGSSEIQYPFEWMVR